MHQSIHHNDASMHYFLQANAENAAMHQQTRAIILKLMADQGIGSERQLAIDCGMSQSTLNRFMSGKTETLEFLHLHNIAQHLNVNKDATHYKELTHAQSETARMRACVAAGACGVRIITRSTACAAGGAVPQDAGAGGMGDGAIALDPATAGRVLDLRESVQSDAAKLAYLREYAQSCYRAGAEGAGGVESAR